MRLAIVAFALGIWFAQQQSSLPGWLPVFGLAAGFACAIAARRFVGERLGTAVALAVTLASAGLGFAWAAAAGKLALADRLAQEFEGRDVTLTGVVASLPQPFERGVRFDSQWKTRSPPGQRRLRSGRRAASCCPGTTGSRRKSSRRSCPFARANGGG